LITEIVLGDGPLETSCILAKEFVTTTYVLSETCH